MKKTHQLSSETLTGRIQLYHLREFNLQETTELKHVNLALPTSSLFDVLKDSLNLELIKHIINEKTPLRAI